MMTGDFGVDADLSMSVMELQIPPMRGAIENFEQVQAYALSRG